MILIATLALISILLMLVDHKSKAPTAMLGTFILLFVAMLSYFDPHVGS